MTASPDSTSAARGGAGTRRVVEGLAELWESTIELLQSLSPDDWRRPTPCAKWDVRQLACHIAAGQGLFEGFPQPPLPEGWTTDEEGVNAATDEMVARRAHWAPAQVLDELVRATDAQVARYRSLDAAEWEQPLAGLGPPGVKTQRGLAQNRLLDGYIHLLDLRAAVGRPLGIGAEPVALADCVDQAVAFTGWGAVKKAGLPEGSRVRLDLSDPCGQTVDLVVRDRRGSLVDPDAGTRERVEGTAPAYLLVSTARPQWADEAGGIRAVGPAAEQLLARYVIWA